MTCAEFDRWLDEGMPEADADAARTHAGSCTRCAAALKAALAIETAFTIEISRGEAGVTARAASIRAPEGFASGVMARIGELEGMRRRHTAEAPSQGWWIRVLSDPVATVSITVSLFMVALLIWDPSWVFGLTGQLAGRWLAWVANAGDIPSSASIRLALLATAVPFALWLVWRVGHELERALVLQITRPRA
ncbi:MAG TPA: hypothetical protein VFP58_05240 [Candidatus Eisenbacteria bacterium]|nr:hypothetical protein [Candidatus Eisenbacteria bacterium]